jgi:hypothetical protein
MHECIHVCEGYADTRITINYSCRSLEYLYDGSANAGCECSACISQCIGVTCKSRVDDGTNEYGIVLVTIRHAQRSIL